MENYVTLFDDNYLPQGIALHRSLMRYGGDFKLWIVCVNQSCYETLSLLNLPRIFLINLNDCETSELLTVKKKRTSAEYCWTLTPFSFDFVFSADPYIQRLTYVDADIWFRKSPTAIFNELDLSGKRVLITDHGYAPEFDVSSTSGQFCVQFLTFYREGPSKILKEWQRQCLDWCCDRFEDGKFGDQKYLDEWPIKYSEFVHILEKEHLTLAPWNATRFPYGNSIIWHFHRLKLRKIDHLNLMKVDLCDPYPLLEVVKKNIYLPYLKDLSEALKIIELARK